MIQRNISRPALAALALAVFSVLALGAAAAAPRINVSLAGVVDRGGRQVPLEEAGRVSPREVISWNVTASNVGDAPATSINVVGDIPEGTAYVAGSGSGAGVVSVKYALDHPHGNLSFSERPMISYVDEGGIARTRPASPDEYKAIQMTFSRIGAGESLKASYRTRVR